MRIRRPTLQLGRPPAGPSVLQFSFYLICYYRTVIYAEYTIYLRRIYELPRQHSYLEQFSRLFVNQSTWFWLSSIAQIAADKRVFAYIIIM